MQHCRARVLEIYSALVEAQAIQEDLLARLREAETPGVPAYKQWEAGTEGARTAGRSLQARQIATDMA